MYFFIYQCIVILLFPLWIMVTLQQKYARQGDKDYCLQRFGLSFPTIHADYWFHCASVGELQTALPLITSLQQQEPAATIIISTNTPTAKHLLDKQQNTNLLHVYMPWDYACLVGRLVNKIHPKNVYILETELWPALFKQCHTRGIPIYIINARLSHKTLSAPTWVTSLYQQCLAQCSHVICQSQQQAENFQHMYKNCKTSVYGNLKYAGHISKTPTKSAITTLTNKPHIALISSHHDEELQLAAVIIKHFPSVLFVIIPRHPERRDTLLRQFAEKNYQVATRSEHHDIASDTHIYLADTMGEVSELICAADICIMGGSFITHGGQNLLEAASLRRAIICGPHMDNFKEICDEFVAQEALISTNMRDIADNIKALLDDAHYRETIAHRAFNISTSKQHILQQYLQFITRTEHSQDAS